MAERTDFLHQRASEIGLLQAVACFPHAHPAGTVEKSDLSDPEEAFVTLLETDRFDEAEGLIDTIVLQSLKSIPDQMILRNNLRVLVLLGKAESGNISCRSAIAKIGPVIDFPPELEARYNALLARSRAELQAELTRKQAERLTAAEAAKAAAAMMVTPEALSNDAVDNSEQSPAVSEAAVALPEPLPDDGKFDEPAAVIHDGVEFDPEDAQASERAASLCACHELIKAITDGRDPPALPFSEEISHELIRVVRKWFIEKMLWSKRKPPVKFAGNLVAVLGTLLQKGLGNSMMTEELVSATGMDRNRIQSVTNEHKSGYYLRCTPWEILGVRGKYKLVAREQRRSG